VRCGGRPLSLQSRLASMSAWLVLRGYDGVGCFRPIDRRFLDSVDDDYLDRSFCRYQLQAKLLVNGCEESRLIGWLLSRRRFRSPFEGEVIFAIEASLRLTRPRVIFEILACPPGHPLFWHLLRSRPPQRGPERHAHGELQIRRIRSESYPKAQIDDLARRVHITCAQP
jgi:hypothetical protein